MSNHVKVIKLFKMVYMFLGPLEHAVEQGDLRKAEASLEMVIYFSNMIMKEIEEGQDQ